MTKHIDPIALGKKIKIFSADSYLYLAFWQNRILWIDEKNLTACVEAGIVGQDLEKQVVLTCQVSSISPCFS